ncbi:MAG: glycoside hydrolase family 5 protein [Prevotella sp.]|nr:glycoside hydrolase family 5 protein [Prevotella sp.]
MLLTTLTIGAQSFENATTAVANMKVGWNLGNTLDACSNGTQGLESETYWGQPYTKPELMKMMKEAGFGAIRVPVTWYNHMNGNQVNSEWMKRVHEVVDYVLNQGMYCIINVHHDTGSGSQWLHASMDVYNNQKARYEALWQQIATEFKDYGEKLLFESYNEMLDKYNSWCFASFNASGRYNATDAADAYQAINSFAQSFVSTVRATGGNNAQRNLIVNTYGACCGEGNWNAHLLDPLKEMKYPNDPAGAGHIAFQVHTYPNINDLNSAKNSITQMFKDLNTYLVAKGGPVIIGEWATSNVDADVPDYERDRAKYLEFIDFFVKEAKKKGLGMFYWMGISDGSSRTLPAFNQPDLAETMMKAFYGSSDGFKFPTREDFGDSYFQVTYSDQWGELNLIPNAIKTADYKQLEVELAEKPASGQFSLKVYPTQKYQSITSEKSTLVFNTSTHGQSITQITLQASAAGYKTSVKSVQLVKKDGTKTACTVYPFWGCSVEEIFTGIRPIVVPFADDQYYDLSGRRVRNPQRGIYIRNGKKILVK